MTVQDASHPFYLHNKGNYSLSVHTGYFQEEHEYEKDGDIQDIFELKNFNYQARSLFGLPNKRQIGMALTFESNGELTKEYSPALNIPSQKVSYSGFQSFELVFQEHLQTKNEKNNLAVEVQIKGSPISAAEKRSSYGGYDLSLSYLYSHDHDEWRIYGDIRAEIIGDKKVKKNNSEHELINAYSLFGNRLGVIWMQKKFWLDTNALFYLTTDYNSSSPSYTRLTDKGFIIGAKAAIGYKISSDSVFLLEHQRQSSTFNVITESTSKGTEFEIENEMTKIGVKWFY